MLQQDEPDDYVIGTGESHSVQEFAEKAFSYAGIELKWKGNGVEEKKNSQKCGFSVGSFT